MIGSGRTLLGFRFESAYYSGESGDISVTDLTTYGVLKSCEMLIHPARQFAAFGS